MNKLFGKENKKGSMQLSINAIVILVMAMAVLGIGLSLITGVLGSGKDKLMSSMDKMDLTQAADSENIITNINEIKLKRGSDETVVAGFYNAGDECSTGFELDFNCSSLTGDNLTVQSAPIKISPGEAGKLGAIVNVQLVGTHICTANVMCDSDEKASTTAFLKVSS